MASRDSQFVRYVQTIRRWNWHKFAKRAEKDASARTLLETGERFGSACIASMDLVPRNTEKREVWLAALRWVAREHEMFAFMSKSHPKDLFAGVIYPAKRATRG